ncbi:hypothetical protein L249_0079 [Ophiocordyceps polyrhachis-furcata BCC 54312]|uniref:Mitochondrial glyco protein n=1 Tax=Ophiocordyceps polyrhachis-furcata BCC 54312 TaxID=1330021 RepID=A0A367LF48_9HYPO|nr:hypothetical protein L249_0079 [Ophiocordyceps polyrhachis-furcata BCC 54312]
MLSLRLAARCAPRMLRHSATTKQTLRNGGITIAGFVSGPSAACTTASASATKSFRAGFSSSRTLEATKKDAAAAAAAPSGEVDEELVFKIDSEIRIEEDLKDDAQLPASIGDFLDNTPFTLEEKPGVEAVKLVRSYGEEKITVSFSISDLDTSFDPYSNDDALEDDLEQGGSKHHDPSSSSSPAQSSTLTSRSASTTQNSRSNQAAENQEEEADMMEDPTEEDEMSEDAPAPITMTIVIEKPAKAPGALSISASARDGAIEVEAISYLPDAKLATSDTPDVVHKRIDLYSGPPFGSLDEDLQLLIERYLDERGINQAMAVFVADYVDAKEQKEYVRWLENIRGFIDA